MNIHNSCSDENLLHLGDGENKETGLPVSVFMCLTPGCGEIVALKETKERKYLKEEN